MCTQNQIHKPLIYTMYTNNIKIQMHTDKHMYISHRNIHQVFLNIHKPMLISTYTNTNTGGVTLHTHISPFALCFHLSL